MAEAQGDEADWSNPTVLEPHLEEGANDGGCPSGLAPLRGTGRTARAG